MNEHGSTSNSSRIPAAVPPSPTQTILRVATSINQPGSSTLIGSGLSCPPSRLEEISSRPHTATKVPAPFESQSQEAARSRPFSASFISSQGDTSVSMTFPDPLNPPIRFPRPHSTTADIMGRTCNNTSSLKQHDSTVEEVQSEFIERPLTTMLLDRPGTAEMLPPRRELPFQRLSEPRSSGSDTGRSSDRPSTGLMGPPALPRSATQRPSSSRSAKSKDVELPPLPQPTVINKIDGGKQQPPHIPDQDRNFFQRTMTSSANRLEKELSFSASSSPLSSPSTPKKLSTPALTSPQTHSASGSKASDLQGSMLEHRIHSPVVAEASYQVSNTSVASSSTVGADDAERLAAYMMQSDEGRRAALNEFVFRHLENEDFLTLVEDMETAWARVALDMR